MTGKPEVSRVLGSDPEGHGGTSETRPGVTDLRKSQEKGWVGPPPPLSGPEHGPLRRCVSPTQVWTRVQSPRLRPRPCRRPLSTGNAYPLFRSDPTLTSEVERRRRRPIQGPGGRSVRKGPEGTLGSSTPVASLDLRTGGVSTRPRADWGGPGKGYLGVPGHLGPCTGPVETSRPVSAPSDPPTSATPTDFHPRRPRCRNRPPGGLGHRGRGPQSPCGKAWKRGPGRGSTFWGGSGTKGHTGATGRHRPRRGRPSRLAGARGKEGTRTGTLVRLD